MSSTANNNKPSPNPTLTQNNNNNNNSQHHDHNTSIAADADLDDASVSDGTTTSSAARTSQRSSQIDPNAVDTLLTQELSGLSFQDRSAINEEIHGVRCIAPVETPELLEASLRELQIELLKYNHLQQKQSTQPTTTATKTTTTTTTPLTAYEEACLIPASYVHTTDFQLRFLRYVLFDVPKAAKKIVDFLQQSTELFGTAQMLQRPIQLLDLGKDGLDCLRCGDFQPLPFRDRSGRRIIAFVNNFGLQYSIEARVSNSERRIFFYCLHNQVQKTRLYSTHTHTHTHTYTQHNSLTQPILPPLVST
jgi:hypothetical protein